MTKPLDVDKCKRRVYSGTCHLRGRRRVRDNRSWELHKQEQTWLVLSACCVLFAPSPLLNMAKVVCDALLQRGLRASPWPNLLGALFSAGAVEASLQASGVRACWTSGLSAGHESGRFASKLAASKGARLLKGPGKSHSRRFIPRRPHPFRAYGQPGDEVLLFLVPC